MPSKTKLKNAAIAARSAALPKIPNELIDQFVTGPMTGEAVNAASMAFKKALIERAMGAELGHHLGYAAGAAKPEALANQRNGKTGKTVLTGEGPVRIEVPRDRNGSFEPVLIPKHERRFTGFDEYIIAMYARGMTMREIQGFLLESYGTEVSAEFISSVTDAVMAQVTAWQARPLEPMYPVVFFDALRVKIKEDAVVRNKAIYLALGVLPDGSRDILGLWIEGTEGAKFWMKVFNDLKTRGVNDILIAVTDDLKGMPEALATVFPATTLQTCIVHLIRNSLDYASWKDRKLLAAAIRPIYTAANAERSGRTGCLRARSQGPEVPHRGGGLAPGLEPCDSVLRLPAADPKGDLHHQRDRERQRQAAQDHQDSRALPQRRCGHQTDLAGAEKHHGRMGARGQGLEGGDEPVCDPL
jgi:putative transposase